MRIQLFWCLKWFNTLSIDTHSKKDYFTSDSVQTVGSWNYKLISPVSLFTEMSTIGTKFSLSQFNHQKRITTYRGSQMSTWSRMSPTSRVIVFQICTQKNESQMSTGAWRTLKLMSAGVLIRRNTVSGLYIITTLWIKFMAKHTLHIKLNQQKTVTTQLRCT